MRTCLIILIKALTPTCGEFQQESLIVVLNSCTPPHQNTGHTEDLGRTYNSSTNSVDQYWSTGNRNGDNQIGRPIATTDFVDRTGRPKLVDRQPNRSTQLVDRTISFQDPPLRKTAIWSTKSVDRIWSTEIGRPTWLPTVRNSN